jgi:hypothetical protein
MSKEQLQDFMNKSLGSDSEIAMGMLIDDLFSLYIQVRKRKVVSIVEYGSGWSTFALSIALSQNKTQAEADENFKIRHPNPFKLLTIDASSYFQNIALERIRESEIDIEVVPVVSEVHMILHQGQVAHVFSNVPPFVADFIYLDGPACDQVQGDINGMHVRFGDSKYKYGLPMSADLLQLEPFFWPGTVIVTDGRGANAQFMKNNFKRKWHYRYDRNVDQHIFELKETPWGGISAAFLNYKKS